MPLAIFGIDNDGLNLAVNLLILFLVVVWLALVAYTYLDAKRRLEDPVLIGCATVASLFPFLGTIVYTILRPPEFLEDKRERELEIRAAQLRVRQLEESSCPNCEHPVERTYLRCPNCRARIKDPCESCGKPVDPRWSICPYCETPTKRGQERQEKRRSSSPPAERAASSRAPSGTRATRTKRPASAATGQKERPKRQTATRRTQSSQTRRPKRSGDDDPRTAPARPDMSRTLILVKPDAFDRALTGEVLARFERKGLRIVALKKMQADEAIANEHYAEHSEKPFFGELVEFITGGPLVAAVLEGHEAVAAARQLIGATNPIEAAPGSIRGDFGLEVTFNMVHGSDSDESAEREIKIWFPDL